MEQKTTQSGRDARVGRPGRMMCQRLRYGLELTLVCGSTNCG
jgi:hypothetical protein